MVRTRFFGLLATVVATLALTGCIQSKTVVLLKNDGSGTIEHVAYVAKTTMPGQPDEKNPFEQAKLGEQCAETAKNLGEGVTLSSATELSDKTGWYGAKVVYAFKDISKLKIATIPPIGSALPVQDDEFFKFEFTGGDDAKVTVTIPELKNKGADDKPATPEEEKMADAMMQQMFKDMLVEFELDLEGGVGETNAANVVAGKKGVMLMRQDMGGMIKDEAAAKKFKESNKIKDSAEFKKLLQDPALKKYITVDPSAKVTVEFE